MYIPLQHLKLESGYNLHQINFLEREKDRRHHKPGHVILTKTKDSVTFKHKNLTCGKDFKDIRIVLRAHSNIRDGAFCKNN